LYKIAKINSKGYYILKELRNNSFQLKETYAENQLKLFHKRQHFIYNVKDEVSKRHSNNIGAISSKKDTPPVDPMDLKNLKHITK